MNILEKMKLFVHVLKWRFTWNRRKLNYLPKNVDNPKFITAHQAAALISDEATVFSAGFAGNARCSVFFWAIRAAFQKTGHPQKLTWINVAAQGGRGKVPGTVEELGLPGLFSKYITGHLETTKAQLKLAEKGLLELHTMPQGVMTYILEQQANKQSYVQSRVGLGTFIDPATGGGTSVTPNAMHEYVETSEDALTYHLPKLDYTLFNAPYADKEGNIYFHHASTLTENRVSIDATRANNGKVLVTVSGIIPKEEAKISVPSDKIDYIIVHPYNEQIISIPQQKNWPIFTPDGVGSTDKTAQKLKFINKLLKITPVRGEVGNLLARLAATLFVEVAPKEAMINIGGGFPEEVARIIVEQGLAKDLLFTTEAGAYGGLPVPGIFFGASIKPRKIISSAEMFHLYEQQLDVAILGFLQVDYAGNVNASKRGPNITDYVGPGGFPDIADGAKTVIFVGSWMANANYTINANKLTVAESGKAKFVAAVDEITFSAKEALKQKKQVYYVTHVGIFKLTNQGLRLIQRMPGIAIENDAFIRKTQLAIENIPFVDSSVITGKNFALRWKKEEAIFD